MPSQEPSQEPVQKPRGGRPKISSSDLRAQIIGVRVSADEFAELKIKADSMGLSPSAWLRNAAISRRLPAPPVPEINRAEYGTLGKLSGNLNQFLKLANEGQPVNFDNSLLADLMAEVNRLRLALLGVKSDSES